MSKLEMSPEILDALQKLSSLLESEDSLERTLQIVADLSVAALPGCDAAGVTLRVNGEDMTAAGSDEFALEIDKIQYDLGGGPCIHALEQGEIVRIDSISEETRWPEFRDRAAEKDLRSSLSHPLKANGSVGALNLYARSERAFDAAAAAVSEIFAKQASIALQNAQTYLVARRLSEQLNEALQSRDIIGQAKGILMEREGIDDEEAFDMLRAISQNANVKLRDVAERLVEEKKNSG